MFQIANHPLLIRRIYNDEDVARFAKRLHYLGAFGSECSVERVVEELKSYNDFSIHRVPFLLDITTLFSLLLDSNCLNPHLSCYLKLL